jgi:tryptophanyl-tRNA synthetase
MRFNHVFGRTFVIPEPAIEESVATVPGIDGQKMSKSYGNTIPIFLEGKQLKKQVMAIQTDSTPVEEPKDPDACNLYNIFKLFAPADRLAEIRKLYVGGGAAYGYIKQELVGLIEGYFKEARLKRAELLQDKEYLRKILADGAYKAREKAAPTLDLVRQRVGLKY